MSSTSKLAEPWKTCQATSGLWRQVSRPRTPYGHPTLLWALLWSGRSGNQVVAGMCGGCKIRIIYKGLHNMHPIVGAIRYHRSSQLRRQHFCIPYFLASITGRWNGPCRLPVRSGHVHTTHLLSYHVTVSENTYNTVLVTKGCCPLCFPTGKPVLLALLFCVLSQLESSHPQEILKSFPRPRTMHHSWPSQQTLQI